MLRPALGTVRRGAGGRVRAYLLIDRLIGLHASVTLLLRTYAFGTLTRLEGRTTRLGRRTGRRCNSNGQGRRTVAIGCACCQARSVAVARIYDGGYPVADYYR